MSTILICIAQRSRLSVTAGLLLGFSLSAFSQGGSPFDLLPRLDTSLQLVAAHEVVPVRSTEAPVPAPLVQRNPFDLVGRTVAPLPEAPPQPLRADTPSLATPGASAAVARPATGSFSAILTFGLLVLLAIAAVVQGGSLSRMWDAVRNANLLNRLQRDQRRGGYYMWAVLGAVLTGSFGFVAARSLGYVPPDAPWGVLGQFVLVALGLTAGKLFVLALLRSVFPLERPLDAYRTLVLVWIGVLGVALFPLTVLIAFAPSEVAVVLAYVGGVLVAIALITRALRALLAASNVVVAYPVHFLLYLCALEIGPLAIGYRLLVG